MLEKYNYSEMPFNSFKGMWFPEIWTPSNFLLFPKCSCHMDYSYLPTGFVENSHKSTRKNSNSMLTLSLHT